VRAAIAAAVHGPDRAGQRQALGAGRKGLLGAQALGDKQSAHPLDFFRQQPRAASQQFDRGGVVQAARFAQVLFVSREGGLQPTQEVAQLRKRPALSSFVHRSHYKGALGAITRNSPALTKK
jgi:hypothetical protein